MCKRNLCFVHTIVIVFCKIYIYPFNDWLTFALTETLFSKDRPLEAGFYTGSPSFANILHVRLYVTYVCCYCMYIVPNEVTFSAFFIIYCIGNILILLGCY